ncbi:MIP receptor 1 [Elysia marginata]|uniref:MIP receptor 1 n=1 Tax=Elysia marginata TaxID=1093978 RepID=A0AAV4GA87_9GAST|nr:MIP receptor 1 [Elysia marginata]
MGAFDTMFNLCTDQVASLYPISFSGNWTAVTNFCTILTTVVASNHKATGVLDFEDVTPTDVGWWVNGLTCTTIACVTVCLNSISIWVFTRRATRSPTHLLLAIVSGLDLLTCVFQVPLQIHVYLRGGYKQLPTRAWCDVYNYVYNFVPAALHSTAFLLNMVLSVQRCVGVKNVQRFRLKALCTYKGTFVSIATCVAASAVVHSLYPINIGVEEVETIGKEMMKTGKLRFVQSCKVSPRHPGAYEGLLSAYIWSRVILLQTIPAVVLGLCNTVLIATSFKVYTYRRRLIGKLGGIASLRNACVPSVEAFKRFGDNVRDRDKDRGEGPQADKSVTGSTLAELGGFRRSLRLDVQETENELYVNNAGSSTSNGREGISSCPSQRLRALNFTVETDVVLAEVSSNSCRTMETIGTCDALKHCSREGVEEYQEDKVTWWDFLREKFVLQKRDRNNSDDQEKDKPVAYLNLESYPCADSRKGSCIENHLDSKKSNPLQDNLNTITTDKIYGNVKHPILKNIDVGSFPCPEIPVDNVCFEPKEDRENYSGASNRCDCSSQRSAALQVQPLSFMGDDFRRADVETVSLSRGLFYPTGYISKWIPKCVCSRRESKLESFSTWPLSRNKNNVASIETYTTAIQMTQCQACKETSTTVVDLDNPTPSSDRIQPFYSRPNRTHDSDVEPESIRTIATKADTPEIPAAYHNRGELRSTLMLVLVTTLTLLAEVYVIVLLIFQFLDSVALKGKTFLSTAELSVMFSVSNLVTLITFPVNFFIFCGLSRGFREALQEGLGKLMTVFKKLTKLF